MICQISKLIFSILCSRREVWGRESRKEMLLEAHSCVCWEGSDKPCYLMALIMYLWTSCNLGKKGVRSNQPRPIYCFACSWSSLSQHMAIIFFSDQKSSSRSWHFLYLVYILFVNPVDLVLKIFLEFNHHSPIPPLLLLWWTWSWSLAWIVH